MSKNYRKTEPVILSCQSKRIKTLVHSFFWLPHRIQVLGTDVCQSLGDQLNPPSLSSTLHSLHNVLLPYHQRDVKDRRRVLLNVNEFLKY